MSYFDKRLITTNNPGHFISAVPHFFKQNIFTNEDNNTLKTTVMAFLAPEGAKEMLILVLFNLLVLTSFLAYSHSSSIEQHS